MHSLAPGLIISAVLWAVIAWCVVGISMLTHHGAFPISCRQLGASLLCIDLAFLVAFMLVERLLED